MNTGIKILIWITVLLFVIWFSIKNKWEKKTKERLNLNNYYKKRYFFTISENQFYRKLYIIIHGIWNDRFVIFSKVRVSDIINTNNNDRWSWKKINPWHFDFVICDKSKDFEPILIVELDWASHNEQSVQERDNIKDEICSHISLPLLRITKNYSNDELQILLNQYLQ